MLTYPLRWPAHLPRTDRREPARFDTPLWKAQNGLADELRRLGARDIEVTTNLPLNRYGQVKATDQRKVTDPGVALYFTRHDEDHCIAVDRWTWVEDNLHAIAKSIEAIRGLERWGTKQLTDNALRGMSALPPVSTAGTNWWGILEVRRDDSLEEIERAFKRLAHAHHPDKGGNRYMFELIQAALQEALVERGR